MKRLISLLLVLLLLIGCAACGEDEDTLVRVSYWNVEDEEKKNVKLSDDKQKELLAFLKALDEDKNWEEGDGTNCIKDYIFETQTRCWQYHSEDGDMTDVTNCRLLFLSQEQANTLHDLLGIPHTTA